MTSNTSIRHLTVIVEAIFSMTGRVTMLGISRWTDKGGSYRTIQRFLATAFSWTALHLKFVETHLFNSKQEYLLAGDATTITKSGKQTFGINRFFSSVLGVAVRGLEFFVISLINVNTRQSSVLGIKQTRWAKDETGTAKKKRLKKRKRSGKKPTNLKGRPVGVKNKDKMKLELSSELLRINELLESILKLLRVFVKVRYLVMDGHFGHNQVVLMGRSNCWELISKLRKDAVLFEKYEGSKRQKERKRRKENG